jgi:hypothetical protein
MEEIINKIWQDAEMFGWDGIKDMKNQYIDLAREKGHIANLHWIECEGEVVVNEISGDVKIVYECGECGEKFGDRATLYQHYNHNHKPQTPL